MSLSTPDKRTLEKQKKLLIKKIMGWIRQCFNDREIGFHPFILCVSIKPSVNSRCATIQSYPNQELWKSLHQLKGQELLSQIIQEVSEKTFKLKDKYDNSLIQQFLTRIQNNFDFCKFYKETQESNYDSEHASQLTELNYINQNTKQFQKIDSESKQLLKQIELCNTKQGSIISIEKQHYHKLSQLYEKICSVPEENYSIEMKKFRNQLSLLLESTESPQKKQVCIKNEFQTEKVDMSIQNTEIQKDEQQHHLLQDIKQEVLSIMPEIVLFLPSEQNIKRVNKNELNQIEEDFFKELYFFKALDSGTLTSYNITFLWKHYFQPMLEQVYHQQQQIKTE